MPAKRTRPGNAESGHGPNPLKSRGQSKAKTRRLADDAIPAATQTGARNTLTRQGGSTKGGGRAGPPSPPPADTSHPSQRGGVRADRPASDPQHESRGTDSGGQPVSGTKQQGPSPADEPSSERTGTAPPAPDRSGGDQRTGKTGDDRHRPRD